MLAAIDALLARAGTDKSKILMCQIFINDLADFPAHERGLGSLGAGRPRAAARHRAGRLAKPEWRVEMVVTAAL